MTISKYHMNQYRTRDVITLQIQDVIDTFLSFASSKLNSKESILVERLKSLELIITPQIMHVFEAPLDKHDFKDLVKQLITLVMDELIERAYKTGIITMKESEMIKNALDESKEIEFCSIYNPAYLY